MPLSGYISDSGVLSDSGKDIKTEADKAAEEIVLNALQSTDYAILSEESGLSIQTRSFLLFVSLYFQLDYRPFGWNL